MGPETLHLYVSNQSFEIDPVDIAVYVDGRQVVCDEFFVEGQHNWIVHDLSLESGEHSLRAVGNDGLTTVEETFELNGERWAVLDFWFHPGETEEFNFLIQDSASPERSHQFGNDSPRVNRSPNLRKEPS